MPPRTHRASACASRAVHGLYLASLPRQARSLDGRLAEPDPIAGRRPPVDGNPQASSTPLPAHSTAAPAWPQQRRAPSQPPSCGQADGHDSGRVSGSSSFAEVSRVWTDPDRWRRFVDVPNPIPTGSASSRGGVGGGSGGGVARHRVPHSQGAAEPRAARTWLPFKPGCNDGLVTATAEGDAATIKSRFWIDAPLRGGVAASSRQNWVTCGWPYWRKMEPVEGIMAPTTNGRRTRGTPPSTRRSSTCRHRPGQVYLLVTSRRRTGSIVVDYALAKPSAARPSEPGVVTFDTGWLLAAKRIHPGRAEWPRHLRRGRQVDPGSPTTS